MTTFEQFNLPKSVQKAIDDYSEAYEKVNNTIEINEAPFNKKLRKTSFAF